MGEAKTTTEVRILAVEQSTEIYVLTGPRREKRRTSVGSGFSGRGLISTCLAAGYGACKTVMVTMGRQCQIILTTGSARLWWWQYVGNVKLYLRPFPASAADLPRSTASLWHQGTSSQMPLGISANKMVQWALHTTHTFSLSFAATQQHMRLQFALKCTQGSKVYCL